MDDFIIIMNIDQKKKDKSRIRPLTSLIQDQVILLIINNILFKDLKEVTN